MFFLAKFRYWLDQFGLQPDHPTASRPRHKIVLGHTLPQGGPQADRITRAFSRSTPHCPSCDSNDFTSDELVSDQTLWSCQNPHCGAMYTVSDVSGFLFVELTLRSRLLGNQS